ncbi:MAG: sugar ABC transporter permease [Bacteriovoracia bacterium]
MMPSRPTLKVFLRQNGAWIGFLLLAVALTVLTDGGFISPRNLTNLLRQASINGVLAAGMTLVILTGGIDLSIGSTVALAGVVAGMSQVFWHWSELGVVGAVATVLLSVGVGTVVGFANGALVSGLGIPPFVITLGMMVVARGVALIFSDGSGISPMGEALRPVGEGYLPTLWTVVIMAAVLGTLVWQQRRALANLIFPVLTFGIVTYAFVDYKGLPVPVLFLLGTLAVTAFVLYQTTLGRCVYAIGSNEQAAYWAGVPVKTVKWIVYTLLGTFSGLAGVLLSARLNSAVPTAGNLFELDAIAAVVIGGTSLKGGAGTIMGCLVGALTIAALNNGMDLLQVSSFYQMIFKGAIIVAAVAMDQTQRNS